MGYNINLASIQRMIACAVDNSGLLANVIFKRIDITLSEPADDFYGEREEDEKVYREFSVRGMVNENPKRNVYGPGGGETMGDIVVTFYNDQGYRPETQDIIEWAGEEYDVTKTERISPYGDGREIGWLVTGTRFA